MTILDLAVHPLAYVTIAELASYWRLSQACVMEYVHAGHLEAISFGPRLYRVRTTKAQEFESRVLVNSRHWQTPPSPRRNAARSSGDLLRSVGPNRVNGQRKTR